MKLTINYFNTMVVKKRNSNSNSKHVIINENNKLAKKCWSRTEYPRSSTKLAVTECKKLGLKIRRVQSLIINPQLQHETLELFRSVTTILVLFLALPINCNELKRLTDCCGIIHFVNSLRFLTTVHVLEFEH